MGHKPEGSNMLDHYNHFNIYLKPKQVTKLVMQLSKKPSVSDLISEKKIFSSK